MATAITKIEPLQLPDVRRPEMMPSLPAWVESRRASLTKALQPNASGKYREMMTLPVALMLNSSERDAIVGHIKAIDRMCDRIPAKDPKAEAETLVVVTKMLLALPSQTKGEAGAEARGEAYMAALDDVPPWAVSAAARRWYRGECGSKHDYRWAPVPAELRALAMVELWRVKGRAAALDELLNAQPLIEFSEEHCAMMREKIGKIPLEFGSKFEAPTATEQTTPTPDQAEAVG